jgi:hypothetical protein
VTKDPFDTALIRTILHGPRPAPVPHPEIAGLRDRLAAEPGWRPDVTAVLRYFHRYRDQPGNAAGGVLRPLLAGNRDDGDIEADREHARDIGDEDGVTLCEALLRMSRTQRGKIAARFDYGPATGGPAP